MSFRKKAKGYISRLTRGTSGGNDSSVRPTNSVPDLPITSPSATPTPSTLVVPAVPRPGAAPPSGIQLTGPNEEMIETRLKALNPSLAACYGSSEAATLQRRECTPNTRKEVLSGLDEWRRDANQGNIFWMNGMAGTGKTTIANTLCATLKREQKLGASFFCTRQLPECRSVNLILPTIAYQLARCSRPFRDALSQALEFDPDLRIKDIPTQLNGMIISPLRRISEPLPTDLVVVIDALDECEDRNGVGQLLELLVNHASQLPIKVFISSRPEEEIRRNLSSMKSQVVLHQLEEKVVTEDIEVYLREELKGTSTDAIISTSMTSSEIITLLENRGCADLTTRLDMNACSKYPVSNGGFGDVYSGRLENGTKVAIKIVREYNPQSAAEGKYQKHAAKELYAWSKCKHPNVAKLMGLAQFRGQLAMISLWAENGALHFYIKKNRSADRGWLSTSICEGLAYLHDNGIVHGDLKGANILVLGDGTPMLIDFGNTSIADPSMRFTTTASQAGLSIRWAAPEILEGSPVSRPGDIYALGMTILETITGAVPFSDLTIDTAVITAVVVKRKTPARPEDQALLKSGDGDALWDLLLKTWSYEPELRPSAAGVRNFMKSLSLVRIPRDANNLPSIPSVPDIPVLSRTEYNSSVDPTAPVAVYQESGTESVEHLLEVNNITISTSMTCTEIITHLGNHGCADLTSRLDMNACSKYPVSNGGFGDVYSGRLEYGTKVAIKVARQDGLSGGTELEGKCQKRAAKELYAWSKCNHPNVARLMGLARFRGRLAMISAWAENGTLPTYVNRNESADRAWLSTSICQGVAYLHNNAIVHGSLKGANVVVSWNGTPMLIDFGDTSVADSSIKFTRTASSASYPLRWTAPEILAGSSLVSRPGDIYALGMTILETMTGAVPFSELATDIPVMVAVMANRKTPARPENQALLKSGDGDALWALLLKTWSYEPELRPSATEVRDFMRSLPSVRMPQPVANEESG